jgi:hypothetical protein
MFVAVALAACSTGGQATRGEPPRWSFESDPVGAVPVGFIVAETNGKGAPATWRVAPGIDPDDPGHVVKVETTNTGSTFNLLLSDAPHPADLTLSVHVLSRRGAEDQGGGLVWRAREAANYYVARWNPLEGNVRLYSVVDSQRTLLESADVVARPQVWHRLAATMRGDAITVEFDGKRCIEWKDTTFGDAGRIGLWTKADASTLFDLIEMTAAGPR